MTKTITITDPMQVKVGDQAYFKDCDFGFPVTVVDIGIEEVPIAVHNPLSGRNSWILLSLFDHATREVEEPEWPKPNDSRLHIYLGSDGKKYIYNPASKSDSRPWVIENSFAFQSTQQISTNNMGALPLQELELIPKEIES